MDKLKNSTILITGGTGSFGNTFIPLTIEKYNPKKIIIYKIWKCLQGQRDGSCSTLSFVNANILHSIKNKIVCYLLYVIGICMRK